MVILRSVSETSSPFDAQAISADLQPKWLNRDTLLAAKKTDAGGESTMVESAEGEELWRVDVVVDEVRIASSGNVNKAATDRPVASAKFEALLQEQIE